jgi:hypothetical protein
MTTAYKAAVEAFARENGIPLFHFERGVRKDDVAAEYRERHGEKEGVVFIGIAQERAYAFKARKQVDGKRVFFHYSRQSVYVNHYYFYLQDRDFGPAFIKVCTYAPYAVKICLNGNEWAKCRLQQHGIAYQDTGRIGVFNTANGPVQAPVYKLDYLAVGGWQVHHLEIGVLDLGDRSGLDGLLGMNFLNHFQFFIDQNESLLRLSAN